MVIVEHCNAETCAFTGIISSGEPSRDYDVDYSAHYSVVGKQMPDMLATLAIGPSPGLSQPNLVPRLGDLLADGKWPRAYVQGLTTMANDVVEWLAIQYLLRFSLASGCHSRGARGQSPEIRSKTCPCLGKLGPGSS